MTDQAEPIGAEGVAGWREAALRAVDVAPGGGELAGYLTYDENGDDEEFMREPLTAGDLEAGCTQKPVYFAIPTAAPAPNVQALVEALMWYADPLNYNTQIPTGRRFRKTVVQLDYGTRASAALATIQAPAGEELHGEGDAPAYYSGGWQPPSKAGNVG